jgi:CheY-like chemotaxis protein
VRVSVEGQTASVSVEDQGLGIAAADMERLFRPFSRIRSPRTAGIEGSGLGLYICERVVRAHGGRLRAESEPERGSVFTFTIPIYGVEAQMRPPLVLVGTTDDVTRRDIRRTGEGLGFAVEETRDGVEAVEAAIRLRPVAMVLDRILPRLRADEVAERLRETPGMGSIALFVLGAPEDLGAKASLFRACLTKPIDRGRLEAALHAVQSPVS